MLVRRARLAGLASLPAFFMIAASAAAANLTITADDSPAVAGMPVTFHIDPRVTAEGDTVTVTFGDGTSGTIAYEVSCALFGGCGTLTHTYAGAGNFQVSGSGTIAGQSVTGSLQLTVTSPVMDSDLYVPASAHTSGINGTNWRSDLSIHNPGQAQAAYRIEMLLRDHDNSLPRSKSFTLSIGETITYHDILSSLFDTSGAASLRVVTTAGKIMVTSRTYNQLDHGSFGQLVPAIARAQAIAFGQEARMIGLSHTSAALGTGSRVALGLVNASPAAITVQADFRAHNGVHLGSSQLFELQPFEFRQIEAVFELVANDPVSDGVIIVRTLTGGARFFAYASVVDNITGDPIFIPAALTP